MRVSFYLTRPKSETDTAIFARCCYEGNKVKYQVGESINPEHWNKKTHRGKQSAKFTEHFEFNARLNNIEAAIKNVYRKYKNDNGKEPSAAIIKNLLDKEFAKTPEVEHRERQLKTFWGFFGEFIKRCENGTRLHHKKHTQLAPNTIKNFGNLYRHLKEFEITQKRKIDFENIDLKFHAAFTSYLATAGNITTKKRLNVKTVTGIDTNTWGKLITLLKVVLREAFEAGYSTNTIFTHRKFIAPQVPTQETYLLPAEIAELENLNLTHNKRLERVRDVFIFGCYTSLRYCDLSRFSNKDIRKGIIEMRQQKTNEMVYIPIRTPVKNILIKYANGLPTAMTNQRFNNYIKEVCALAPSLQQELILNGETKPKHQFISSHTARRTFATNEYNAGDLTIGEIRAITGHKTDKAFYTYIRTTPQENTENIAKKWLDRELKEAVMTPMLKAV